MPDINNIEKTLQEILTEQAGMREQIKSALKRIDEQNRLALSVQELTLSVRDLANEQKNTSKTVASIRTDVDELKSKPAKRWDSAVSLVVTAIVTAVITFVLTQVGLK